MGFNPKQRLAITKAILELTDLEGDTNQAEHKARKGNKFKDNSKS